MAHETPKDKAAKGSEAAPPEHSPLIGASPDDALIAQLEAGYPPAWIPANAGDTIVGAFLRLETGQTAFGPAQVAVVGTTEGERSVFLFYESLKTGFRRAQPEPGERIAVKYNGELPSKNPTPGRKPTYHDFSVAVDRPTAKPVDWNAALGEDTGRAPADEPSPSDVG